MATIDDVVLGRAIWPRSITGCEPVEMPRIFDRRPLGWLLLAVFSALYSCRAAVGAIIAVTHGEHVVVFWRVVELVFFAWFAVASMRRTSASVADPAA